MSCYLWLSPCNITAVSLAYRLFDSVVYRMFKLDNVCPQWDGSTLAFWSAVQELGSNDESGYFISYSASAFCKLRILAQLLLDTIGITARCTPLGYSFPPVRRMSSSVRVLVLQVSKVEQMKLRLEPTCVLAFYQLYTFENYHLTF